MSAGMNAALEPVKVALRAAIVLVVVGFILDVPGRLGVGLFTEQMLVTVLGLALALTFLTFPFGARETGEEAVAKAVLTREQVSAGWIDIALAIVSLAACFYVAIRYPELISEQ